MKLILARHGQTEWNREKRVQGISDIALNSLGIEQAGRLAEALRGEQVERILSSSLKRAVQTAEAVNRFHGLPVEQDNNLGELDQGDFEGRTFPDIMATHADFLRKWRADPASVTMPGGESLAILQKRAWQTVEQVLSTEKNTLIVSHNFTIMTILCTIQGMGLERVREVHVGTASRSIVEYENGLGVVTVFNDTSHLAQLQDVQR